MESGPSGPNRNRSSLSDSKNIFSIERETVKYRTNRENGEQREKREQSPKREKETKGQPLLT